MLALLASSVDGLMVGTGIGLSMDDCPNNEFWSSVNMVMASGENLSTGQTIFLKVKGMGSSSSDVPRQCRVCAHFEKVISIQDTVVEVFD